MSRRFLLCLVIICLIQLPVYASDLYLLEINSETDLSQVNNIVDNAFGRIDGKFIVDLEEQQISRLKAVNIQLESLVGDISPDNLYIISKIHPDMSEPILRKDAVYSSEYKHLAQLNKEDIKQLRKDGYMVRQIGQRKTPFFYHAPQIAAPALDSYPLDSIADLVNQDSLYSYVTTLENFQTRYLETDSILAARDWLMQKMTDFGYNNVTSDLFLVYDANDEIYNHPCYNVSCTKIGYEEPDKFIVIGAHYDSYSFGPSDKMYFAPGADDNATGTAAVLELARIFKNIDTKKTLIFVPFSAEEVGLYGAEHCASEMYNESADIELMLNYDMIAYEADAINDWYISYSCPVPYLNVFAEAGTRVSELIPVIGHHAYCDAEPFDDYGYQNITAVEETICPSVHRDYDVSDSLDFGYMENIVRATLVSVAIIESAPEPISCELFDIGDGQSLRVIWDECDSEMQYKVVYGTGVNSLNDTIDVSPPDCTQDITGLTEGEEYYVAVVGYDAHGYHPIALEVSSMIPQSVPRTPEGISTRPDIGAIQLSWQANVELDISHYKVFRKPVGYSWEVISENWPDTIYNDDGVTVHQEYMYKICAVDYDGFMSDTSNTVTAVPVSLDLGILLVDETQAGGENPGESEQLVFYNNLLSSHTFSKIKIDSTDDTLNQSLAGQYNPIIWIDDDNYNHVIGNSLGSLEWYLSFNTDFLLAGWSTIYSQTGQAYFYPENFYYEQLGLSYIAENPITDFTGATGVNGWPDLELKPEAPGGGRLSNIDRFAATPNAEVIYTFDSYSGNPAYNNKPVGIAIDTYHGKRVVLGFPLYWLTEASAQALITKVFEYYSEESILYGDVNGDWAINILDVTALISYLYQGGEPPADINNGDPNGDCVVNILDITYFISYLYKGGSVPIEGCVF